MTWQVGTTVWTPIEAVISMLHCNLDCRLENLIVLHPGPDMTQVERHLTSVMHWLHRKQSNGSAPISLGAVIAITTRLKTRFLSRTIYPRGGHLDPGTNSLGSDQGLTMLRAP